MATTGLLERVSLGLKRIQEDPWLFLGPGAVIVLFAVLSILAGSVRATGEMIEDDALASTAGAPVQSSSIAKPSPSAVSGNSSP